MIIKKIFFLLAISMISYVKAAEKNTITFTSQEVTAILQKENLSHFIEKTNIVQNLSEYPKVPLGVVMAFDLALYDYSRDLQHSTSSSTIQLKRSQIIAALLASHPTAIEELKKEGVLK